MSPAPSIVVDNLQEDEVLSYPLVLLEGRVTGLSPHTSHLFLEARLDHLRSSLWPISAPSGRFKAFMLLPSEGQFAVTLRLAGVVERIFCIEYRPRVTRYMVKFHYQICSDSDARDGFDAPPGVDNSDAAAIAKLHERPRAVY
ncbi:Jacalin-like lectin domain-containing protein [Phytophthora cinnamomi]|uniref:Jacalin-like lectin domain-containing protein n=1 Tax=Phytophthora cinnamomi TaxID=4785 RepID=UPI00355A5099|nr:Jacalin-like lectin domain-containing protein [Phytophthora cinnamomi]